MARPRKAMEHLQDVVRLHRKKYSIRKISKVVGMSRNTVRKYVRAFEAAGVLEGGHSEVPEQAVLKAALEKAFPQKRGKQECTRLGEYEGQVAELLKKGAGPKAIFDKLKRDTDYDGSYSMIKRYGASRRPVNPESVAITIPHLPGDSMQVDFGYVGRIPDVDGVKRKAYVFVAVLPHSKAMWADIVFDQTAETWLRMHMRAFAAFQGVPSRVVPDNLKAAVIQHAWGVDGTHDLNRSYRELAHHYDFIIDPTPPYSPEKKGVVENGVRYVKNNFFVCREPLSIEDEREALKKWLRLTANNRIHGTTGRVPREVLKLEMPKLGKLPRVKFEVCRWETRKVHQDAHVMVGRIRFSVPWEHIGQQVNVKVTKMSVTIYHELARIADHDRPSSSVTVVTKEAHLPAQRVSRRHRNIEHWLTVAGERGPDVVRYVQMLVTSDPVTSQVRRIIRSLDRLELLPLARQNSVCAHAVTYGNVRYDALKTIIDDGLDEEPTLPTAMVPDTSQPFRFARTFNELLTAAARRGVTDGYN